MLGLTVSERIARALADLRMGLPVVLHGQHPMLFAATETITQDRYNALLSFDQAPILVVTQRRAETIKIYAFDGSFARISVPADRTLSWIKQVADPAYDMSAGLRGPFQTLMTPAFGGEDTALSLLKLAHLLPAAIVVPLTQAQTTQVTDLTQLNQSEIAPLLKAPIALHDVASARLPTQTANVGRLHIFRSETGHGEHYAMEIGRLDREQPILLRLHSACFTGDVMGSLKCDCGPQLHAALTQMGHAGSGLLLYLNQEGRGIGLANKMRAYTLQDQGFDTVEANHRLGFEDDERDFRLGASILKEMGISKIRLLTNNPRKIDIIERNGITVTERVPLQVGQNKENAQYLATKAKKSGHML